MSLRSPSATSERARSVCWWLGPVSSCPAATITGLLAWGYVRFGALPKVAGLLYGIKPVVIAIVLQALVALAPKALKTRGSIAVALAALLATALGLSALPVLVGAGILTLTARSAVRGTGNSGALSVAWLGKVLLGPSTGPVTLLGILGVFVKMGAVVFGSGYVLLAFLRADLVERLHWLTEAQLLDAVAVGQITPGPVFSSATFVGYLLAGAPGALVATFGVFLPAFVFVAASRPLLSRVGKSRTVRNLLDGVNVASLSLMAVVTVQLGRAALLDAGTWLIALVSSLLLFRWRLNSLWLVLGGGSRARCFTACIERRVAARRSWPSNDFDGHRARHWALSLRRRITAPPHDPTHLSARCAHRGGVRHSLFAEPLRRRKQSNGNHFCFHRARIGRRKGILAL